MCGSSRWLRACALSPCSRAVRCQQTQALRALSETEAHVSAGRGRHARRERRRLAGVPAQGCALPSDARKMVRSGNSAICRSAGPARPARSAGQRSLANREKAATPQRITMRWIRGRRVDGLAFQPASAAPASLRMRASIEASPFDRCAVSAPLTPISSSRASASKVAISGAGAPE